MPGFLNRMFAKNRESEEDRVDRILDSNADDEAAAASREARREERWRRTTEAVESSRRKVSEVIGRAGYLLDRDALDSMERIERILGGKAASGHPIKPEPPSALGAGAHQLAFRALTEIVRKHGSDLPEYILKCVKKSKKHMETKSGRDSATGRTRDDWREKLEESWPNAAIWRGRPVKFSAPGAEDRISFFDPENRHGPLGGMESIRIPKVIAVDMMAVLVNERLNSNHRGAEAEGAELPRGSVFWNECKVSWWIEDGRIAILDPIADEKEFLKGDAAKLESNSWAIRCAAGDLLDRKHMTRNRNGWRAGIWRNSVFHWDADSENRLIRLTDPLDPEGRVAGAVAAPVKYFDECGWGEEENIIGVARAFLDALHSEQRSDRAPPATHGVTAADGTDVAYVLEPVTDRVHAYHPPSRSWKTVRAEPGETASQAAIRAVGLMKKRPSAAPMI